ncbi:UDP-N-acetylglucosamine 1-carboxyvinyltransferase [Candidatus Poribacteria bacterium]|nr:UDP-N-acetylglucosamine 1-carboxyvinyltransferase [Candidatus Poribacteria bacterium]MYG05132.1 UDP-N-acetylglucosamine 1-carboxyvinyltransferase [Candidatus Poribacteria bacterium]MYK22225.1 UDP-N-acetylglucosamine 1-carboxyvinyltransferase [Candidatus Poribacteria bacterium]
MEKLIIKGGTRLEGTIPVSGCKNAVLPIAVAAAILGDGVSVLHNVPNLTDVMTLRAVLEGLGATIKFKNSTLYIEPINHLEYEAPYELVRKMRASIYVLGPLVAKLGKAKVSFPGGCAIGPRPIDLHIRGLEHLGAEVMVEKGYIYAQAERLIGTEMYLTGQHGPSVGATANVMMAATLAQGTTVIRGAACEPHISDLARFLNAMGADIEGIGTSVLTIRGVKQLRGTEHTVISDDIEAGTFIVAGAITRGDVYVEGITQQQIPAISEKIVEAGVELDWDNTGVRVTTPREIRGIDVSTAPFPGFPTDMQAQIMGMLCLASGTSIINENVHTDRFIHAAELNRMGADIMLDGGKAIINGVPNFSGAPVMASDLRAGAVLVAAGMAASGETVVSRVYHIDRGYESIEKKLNNVGANIKRVDE